ncbi:MAG: hydrogenase expression/formation protein [Burkholderiales bacterium]
MKTLPGSRPFPIPVVALGPGSQEDDGALDYPVLPRGMDTYHPPSLPEPAELARHGGAMRVLRMTLDALDTAANGAVPAPVLLDGLAQEDLALIHQVLGEGEVSAQVLPAAGGDGVWIQESVFAGVWRMVETRADGSTRDTIEVGRIPAILRTVAMEDAAAVRPVAPPPPATVLHAPALLAELSDQRRLWRPGRPEHVMNLTLLPLSRDDIGYLDLCLGTGRVLILSRGYGNCRITSAAVANTWRVVYYNSQDAVILNTVEVGDLPEVACAAPEDLADSRERFAEVLQWVEQA